MAKLQSQHSSFLFMVRIIEKPVAFIAVGVAVLICAQLWPGLPVVTAVALIGLGACQVTLSNSPSIPLLSAAQWIVYAGLVALFLGARLHAESKENLPVGAIDMLDFSLALILMAAAGKTMLGALLSRDNIR